MKTLLILMSLASLLFGCTPLERDAYRLGVASQAFIKSIQSAHPECSLPVYPIGGGVLCTNLQKAVAAQHLLVDAGEGYCHVTQLPATDTTPCQPSPKGTPAYAQATAALQQAIAGWSRAQADLKAVIK